MERCCAAIRPGIALSAIARTFNLSRATITRRARVSCWARGRASVRRACPRQSAQGQSSARPQVTGAREAGTADPRTALLQRQRTAWAQWEALPDEAFRIPCGETPAWLGRMAADSPKARLSLAAKLMSMFERSTRALMVVQEGERRTC